MQKIEIIIDGDNIKAVNAISGTETQLKKLDKKAQETTGIFGDVSKLINQHLGGISVGAAVTGLGLLIKNAIDTGDKFHDMAQKTGIAVETLSVLDYAAKLNSTDIDSLAKVMSKLSRNIYEADQGTGKAGDAFRTLGITARDSSGHLRKVDDVFLDLAKKYKDMPDGIQKVALSQIIMNKSGAESIPILNDLGVNFEKYKKQLQDVGGIITTEFANKADQLKDDLTTLNYAVKGVGISLASDLLPSLTAAATALVQVSTQSQGSMGLLELLSGAIKVTATALGGVAVGAIVAGEALGTYWAALAKAATFHFGDAVDIIKNGFGQIEKTALDAGKIFDAMWNPDKYKDSSEALAKGLKQQEELAIQTQKTQDAAKKKAEEFKKVTDDINFQISLFGLSEIDTKLAQITRKFQDLKRQFGDKPIFAKGLLSEKDAALAEYYGAQMQKLDEKGKKKIERDKEFSDYKNQLVQDEMEAWINSEDEKYWKAINNDIAQRQMATDSFSYMSDAMLAFYDASGQKSAEMFALYKAFAIGQAVMNTYEGASKALAQGGVFGPILAGAVIAFGLAQVAKIAATQPGAGASGNAGGSMSASAIPTSQPAANAYQNNSTSNSTQTVVHKTLIINGDVLDAQNWFRNHRDDIQRFFDDGNIDFGDS